MFRIIAVTDSHSHFSEAIDEYLKRLRGKLEFKTIKPERSEDPVIIRRKESLRIKELIQKEKAPLIYCDVGAKVLSTEALFAFSEKSKHSHPDLLFLIAGAYGIDEEILAPFISERISFSPMTFPHSLALLVLLEQIYRIEQIGKNSGYHH